MPRARASVLAVGSTSLALAALALAGSCGEGNPGIDPPDASMAFPTGLLLDPRVSTDPVVESCDPSVVDSCSDGRECVDQICVCTSDDACPGSALCGADGLCRAPARWLFVTNANSDRRYNAGSLLAVDLDAFWDAAFGDPGSIPGPTASLDADGQLCRRVANMPQMVECLEEPFVAADKTVHFGNFPGPAVAWTRSDEHATLLIPVRGDPSITYVELTGQANASFELECGQANDDDGQRRCDPAYRLRFLHNDPEKPRLAREPFRILVDNDPEQPLAYVTHQGDPDITLIALEGRYGAGGTKPTIVHQANLLAIDGAVADVQGGFGIAQRRCDVDTGNAPSSTLDCTRPLIYAGMRWIPQIRELTAIAHSDVVEDPGADCLVPGERPELGQLLCDPQASPISAIGAGNLSTFGVPLATSRPILADIAFSRTGNELYVVQSNPGALLRIDTSVGPDGETLDVPFGQVEICAQATSFVIYDDGINQYGVVTCYRSGEVFIVDLISLAVVGLSRAGIGPDAMAVDTAREVVYVANSLDATISVIEMSPDSPSRFTQIARIGAQEPYVQ